MPAELHDWVSAIGSAGSALIAGVGLRFIWVQVKMGTKALQDQVDASNDRAESARLLAKARLLEMSEPINRLLLAYPQLFNLTYLEEQAHVPEPGSDDWKRAMILCEMQGNYLEFVVQAVGSFSNEERIAWQNFARDTFNRPTF